MLEPMIKPTKMIIQISLDFLPIEKLFDSKRSDVVFLFVNILSSTIMLQILTFDVKVNLVGTFNRLTSNFDQNHR